MNLARRFQSVALRLGFYLNDDHAEALETAAQHYAEVELRVTEHVSEAVLVSRGHSVEHYVKECLVRKVWDKCRTEGLAPVWLPEPRRIHSPWKGLVAFELVVKARRLAAKP